MMISIRNTSKIYESKAGSFNALRNVDLDVARGEFVAIVGRSGSGKSTLLNLIGGIDRPTAGSIVVGDRQLQNLSEQQLAQWRGRHVGFVFQFFQLLPTLTAMENVMLAMDFCEVVPPRQRREKAMALLAQFGVGRHAAKLPSALSGGEQQRVAIARALANDPSVVLADEPTGNLDSSNAEAVLELFRQMSSSGVTVLVVTHDSEVASGIDQVIELADGAIIRGRSAVQAARA